MAGKSLKQRLDKLEAILKPKHGYSIVLKKGGALMQKVDKNPEANYRVVIHVSF